MAGAVKKSCSIDLSFGNIFDAGEPTGGMADEPVRADTGDQRDWATLDTALDITVNVIPMVILLFFVGLYTVIRPWEWDPVLFVLMHFLTLFPLVLLAVLTYVSARAIASDEQGA